MTDLKDRLSDIAKALEERMDDMLPHEAAGRIGENRLARAIRYSALSSGKRLRPFMVVESAKLFGVSTESALQVAAAIEFVHVYSLIHDDLPAMDDDDMRRGQPSCHKQFDEPTAILAGDALLTYAFEVLAHESTHPDPTVRCQLVTAFAQASGTKGMIGGQMIDMLSEDRDLNIDEITRLQRMKTGALFAVSCEAGAILGKASRTMRTALRAYAHDIGLAFQITDDLLDAREDEVDGRHDKSAEKGTYISAMGLEKAERQAGLLVDQAISHLDVFGKRGEVLSDLARFVLHRTF